jgi:hypothetical protein
MKQTIFTILYVPGPVTYPRPGVREQTIEAVVLIHHGDRITNIKKTFEIIF